MKIEYDIICLPPRVKFYDLLAITRPMLILYNSNSIILSFLKCFILHVNDPNNYNNNINAPK